MSEASIQRTLDRFVGQIPMIRSAADGETLVNDFMTTIAEDYAATVFLIMQTKLERTPPKGRARLREWMESYQETAGLDLLAAVHSTLQHYHCEVAHIQKALNLSAAAFRDQLERLMVSVQTGGAA